MTWKTGSCSYFIALRRIASAHFRASFAATRLPVAISELARDSQITAAASRSLTRPPRSVGARYAARPGPSSPAVTPCPSAAGRSSASRCRQSMGKRSRTMTVPPRSGTGYSRSCSRCLLSRLARSGGAERPQVKSAVAKVPSDAHYIAGHAAAAHVPRSASACRRALRLPLLLGHVSHCCPPGRRPAQSISMKSPLLASRGLAASNRIAASTAPSLRLGSPGMCSMMNCDSRSICCPAVSVCTVASCCAWAAASASRATRLTPRSVGSWRGAPPARRPTEAGVRHTMSTGRHRRCTSRTDSGPGAVPPARPSRPGSRQTYASRSACNPPTGPSDSGCTMISSAG
jgi:hypothetical protein